MRFNPFHDPLFAPRAFLFRDASCSSSEKEKHGASFSASELPPVSWTAG
jgi:hypothetical protein